MMLRSRFIGLDMGSGFIKMALVESSLGKAPVLVGLEVCGDLSEVLEILQQPPWSTSTDRICLCFPSDRLIVRRMKLPFAEKDKIKKTLPYEMESEIPFGVEEVVTRYIIIQRSSEGAELLAMAFPKAHIRQYLDTLKSSGIDPIVIEPEAVALARAILRSHTPDNGALCVLDIGASKCNLLFFHDQKLQHVRSLPYGEKVDPKAPPSDLAQEISRTLLSLQLRLNLPAPGQVVICGGGATESNSRWLEETLRLPVHILNPVEDLQHQLSAMPREPALFSTAISLALFDSRAPVSCNLREGEFAYEPRLSLFRGKAIAASGILILAAALAMADLQVHLSRKRHQLDSIKAEQRVLFRKVYPQPAHIVDPELQLRRLLEKKTSSRQVHLLAMDPSTSALEALREISLRVQANLPLRIKVFDLNGELISIRGEAASYNVIEQAKERWQGSPLFSEVQVKDAKKNPKTQLWEFQCIARRTSR
jgi:general secretion pathway protein L